MYTHPWKAQVLSVLIFQLYLSSFCWHFYSCNVMIILLLVVVLFCFFFRVSAVSVCTFFHFWRAVHDLSGTRSRDHTSAAASIARVCVCMRRVLLQRCTVGILFIFFFPHSVSKPNIYYAVTQLSQALKLLCTHTHPSLWWDHLLLLLRWTTLPSVRGEN